MAGANVRNMSIENGYGTPSDKPMSKGEATYVSSPALPMMVNDNFTEERFSGKPGGQARIQASAPGEKDSIETMGKSDEAVARKM